MVAFVFALKMKQTVLLHVLGSDEIVARLKFGAQSNLKCILAFNKIALDS